MRPIPTRTLNPLPFQDLEPKRFEDLVRQLLYDFRNWRQIEATGRAGTDESFDIRAWEVVPQHEAIEIVEEEESEEDAEVPNDRLWLVQCKREKSIGPTKLEHYLSEIPQEVRAEIHGIVFAAACDFSKTARDRFKIVCREMGFAECYLWGKSEIEDALFQPKNDNLLFAYFGISLQVRKRKLATDLRARIAIKKRLAKLLQRGDQVIIRDAADDRYPFLDKNIKLNRYERGRWAKLQFKKCAYNGVRIIIHEHFAYLSMDGKEWDFAEAMDDAIDDLWIDSEDLEKSKLERARHRHHAWILWDTFPNEERAKYKVIGVIPYENIVAIDELADDISRGPHLYVVGWNQKQGPFLNGMYLHFQTIDEYAPRIGNDAPDNRVKKFLRKREDVPRSEDGSVIIS